MASEARGIDNKKTKKENLNVKHQEEGNEQIVESKKKSKKNKRKNNNNSAPQNTEENSIANIENQQVEKEQLAEDEGPSKKKMKLKKNKKNRDKNNSNAAEKDLKSEQDNATEEIDEDDEGEEGKPKKGPSKRQLKREKAALREAETKEAGKQENAAKALNYVSKWKHAKHEWKFNKVVQTWLIHNLLDENYVPDNQYTTVLEYFEGCVGSARKQLIDKAMAVIKKVEEQVVNEENEDEDIVETTEYKRARQLVQTLPT